MARQVGRRRVYSDDRANRPSVSAAQAVSRPESVAWFDVAYDQAGRSRSGSASSAAIRPPASRPDIVPALLQLLGWVGWLGIGYVAWGRVLFGILMLIAWWAVFWVLSFFTLVTQTVALPLALLAWFLVPLITSVALWVEARREYSPVGPFEPMDAELHRAAYGVIVDALDRPFRIDVPESKSNAAKVPGVSPGARRVMPADLFRHLEGRSVHYAAFEDEAVQRKGGRHHER